MRKPFDDSFAKSVICFAVQNVQNKKNMKDLIHLKGKSCACTASRAREGARTASSLTSVLMNIYIQYAAPLILHYSNPQDYFTVARHQDVHT